MFLPITYSMMDASLPVRIRLAAKPRAHIKAGNRAGIVHPFRYADEW